MIEISERIHVILEMIALQENMTPEAVIAKMVKEYKTTDELEQAENGEMK